MKTNNYGTKVYGRKVIKGYQDEVVKRLYLSWGICLLIGLVIGFVIGWGVSHLTSNKIEYGVITEVEAADVPVLVGSALEENFIPLDVPMDEDLQKYIYCLAHAYNIDYSFVMAIITQESSFRTDIVSTSNDYGLMQINSINHEWLTEQLGVTDFLDPYQNTWSGVFILKTLFEKYEDPGLVLMAYNMGESGASRLWNKGIYESTYSKSILEIASEYQLQISEREGE